MEYEIQNQDLIRQIQDNGGPFLPVCLCLDTSASMKLKVSKQSGADSPTRLQMVQDGLNSLYQAVSQNPDARDVVHTSVVTFDAEVRVVRNFSVPENPPLLQLGNNDGTAMGGGVLMALNLISEHEALLEKQGTDRYQPWLILMSDGIDTIGRRAFEAAKLRIEDMTRANQLNVFAFGIGEDASLPRLRELSPELPALRLEEAGISHMFDWLSKAIIKVSSGEIDGRSKIGLEPYRIGSWGDAYY